MLDGLRNHRIVEQNGAQYHPLAVITARQRLFKVLLSSVVRKNTRHQLLRKSQNLPETHGDIDSGEKRDRKNDFAVSNDTRFPGLVTKNRRRFLLALNRKFVNRGFEHSHRFFMSPNSFVVVFRPFPAQKNVRPILHKPGQVHFQ
jgi:hypothetical protein